MPCNPAVGGTAKGHLVREIDALGGLMGRAIDATGIQFKLLNRSRGPAVQSPRAQADKQRYSAWVDEALAREPNITWILGKAGQILVESGRVVGLAMEDGDRHECQALVITAGTFLNGLIHVGSGAARRRAARRAAVVRAGGLDYLLRVRGRAAQDGHAAAVAPREHRLRGGRGAGTVRRGEWRRDAGAVLVRDDSAAHEPDSVLAAVHQRSRSGSRPRPHR